MSVTINQADNTITSQTQQQSSVSGLVSITTDLPEVPLVVMDSDAPHQLFTIEYTLSGSGGVIGSPSELGTLTVIKGILVLTSDVNSDLSVQVHVVDYVVEASGSPRALDVVVDIDGAQAILSGQNNTGSGSPLVYEEIAWTITSVVTKTTL